MQLEFDVHGKIVRVVPVARNDAHRLIEECMLAANVCTAGFLANQMNLATPNHWLFLLFLLLLLALPFCCELRIFLLV